MVARVTRIEVVPEKLDETLAEFREVTLPALRAVDGFDGVTLLADRAAGVILGTTFWESEDHMARAEEAGEEARRRTAETGGAQSEPTREVFDVAVVQTAQV